MNRVLILAMTTVGFVAADGVVRADDKSHKAAAEQLLKAADMEKNFEKAIDVMIEAQVKANPQLAKTKDVMRGFISKYMNYASLKDDLIKIYTDEFTEAELKTIAEFYSTPLGKKMITKMPALMQKGSELGVKRLQEHGDELRKLIEEELMKK